MNARADYKGIGLYTVAILLSAWLVFWMEPLYVKMMLPTFGGTPTVWVTALMFFQAVLLIGYIYAHLLIRLQNVLAQGAVHLALVLIAVIFLPPTIGDVDMGDMAVAPLTHVLTMLATGVAMPMVVLSATAPLVQHWFSRTGHAHAADPYFLYAASNLGSFGALVAFPLLLEPTMPLGEQSTLWSVLFGLAMALILLCAYSVRNKPAPVSATLDAHSEVAASSTSVQWAWWVVLAAVPSSLLSGISSILTTDIAAIPLLWVLPLTVFLGTFVIAFAGISLFSVRAQRIAIGISMLAMSILLVLMAAGSHSSIGVFWLIVLCLVVQFILSLACHQVLYARRPGAAHLTEFYVAVAIGGLLGGTFNAVVAPLLFVDNTEILFALVLAVALSRQLSEFDCPPLRKLLKTVAIALALGVLAWGLVLLVRYADSGWATSGLSSYFIWKYTVWLVPCIVVAALMRVPLIHAVTLAILFVSMTIGVEFEGQIFVERNFFGTIRVIDDVEGGSRKLRHGTTTHGKQSLDPAKAKQKLAYYGGNSAVNHVFQYFKADLEGGKIGVVGLGAGTLSCYKSPGQEWRYYEIDPAMARVASDPQYFTFLSTCDPSASVDNGAILLGDARRQLEMGDDVFDLIVLDAFTSDAIPLHLLTVQAVQTYLKHLTPGGLLVFNISNRHLDLHGPLARIAQELGLSAVAASSATKGDNQYLSQWFVMAPNIDLPSRVGAVNQSSVYWQVYNLDTIYRRAQGTPLWTDDYSNILTSLNWFKR